MSEADETEWPPHLDALVAAPSNHRLLHEDDEVRVLEVTVQPGERENLHHPRWSSIMVVLARPDYRNFDADGNEIPHLVERRPARFCRGPCACHRSGCTQLRLRLTRRTAFRASGSSSKRPRCKEPLAVPYCALCELRGGLLCRCRLRRQDRAFGHVQGA